MSALAGTVLAAACGGPPNNPSPLPGLSLTCPPRTEAATPSVDGIQVAFAVAPTGGRPPVSVVCSPASGSTFALGETIVSCTATDSGAQSASCSFPVTVTRTPTLAWTRFLAFGDSITEGVTGFAPDVLTLLDFPDAYPGQLQRMLAARYTAQTIEVLNRGIAGERVAIGRRRLPGVLDADRPEVLLLLEGVNNIRNVTTDVLAGDVDQMVREARSRRIEVLLVTLLPISDDLEARDSWAGTQKAIRELNEQIHRIAQKNGLGAPVDLYTVFLQDRSLLGADGLHPTPAGYTRMASVFFETIRTRYEVNGPSGAGPGR